MFKFLKNDYYWALFWLIIILAIFFLPVIIGRQILFDATSAVFSSPSGKFYQLPGLKTGWAWGGITAVEAPQTMIGVRMLRDGIFPLWSPHTVGGFPLAAGMFGGFYFPIKLIIFYLFPYLATFNFWLIFRLLIAGFGTFLFLKELGLSRQSSLLGAIGYMLSGHLIVNFLQWWLNVAIIFPYAMFSIERYFRTLNKKYIGVGAIFLALMILGGQFQTVFIVGLFIVSYFLFRLFSNKHWRLLWKDYLIFSILAGFLAILLVLPMLIDFFVFYSQGTPNYLNDYHSVWRHYSGYQLLYFFVSPTMFLELALVGRIQSASIPIIFPYFSIIITILAILGFCVSKKDKIPYFFLGFSGFLLLKYFGIPPFYQISHIPPFNSISWLDHDNLLYFLIAVLAAFGYESLRTQKINFKKFLTILSVIPLIFLAVFIFAKDTFLKLYLPNFDLGIRREGPLNAFKAFLDKLPNFIEKIIIGFINHPIYFVYLLFGVVALFAILALVVIWRYTIKKSYWAYSLILILLIAELFVYMPKIRDGGFKRFNPYPRHPAINFLEEQIGNQPIRFIGSKDVMVPHASALFGLQDFRTNDIFETKRYLAFSRQFMWLANKSYIKFLTKGLTKNPDIFIGVSLSFNELDYAPKLHRFFDMANIKYMVTEEPIVNDKDLIQVFNQEGLIMYENITVLPRAYLVHDFASVKSIDEAIDILNDPYFDYRNSVILEDDSKIKLPITNYQLPISKTQIVNYQPNKVEISINTEQDGILVLTDAHYPGWNAYIDGQKTKIYPANIMFRAVKVSAGQHTIVFKYQPWWVYLGFLISFITLLGIIIFWFRKHPKRMTQLPITNY